MVQTDFSFESPFSQLLKVLMEQGWILKSRNIGSSILSTSEKEKLLVGLITDEDTFHQFRQVVDDLH